MHHAKRKICFVITSKIHYARSLKLLRKLQKMRNIELQIVVAGAAILTRHGNVELSLLRDGLSAAARITMVLEGGSTVAMAKTTGIGMLEFATVFENLRPDVVVVRGDRFEVIAPAAAAAYMNYTIAHIEGGDVTGSIDESVRHAITKLSHIHFATNKDACARIVRMGENPRYVFNVGAPEVELAAESRGRITSADINTHGVGGPFNVSRDFVIVMHHSVTTEMGRNEAQMNEVLRAVHALRMPAVFFWPNIDAGTDEVTRAINHFRATTDIDRYAHFLKYLEPEKFLALLKKSRCLIGNSSSGIKECSYLGIPVVNIGSRQTGRLRGKNVIDVPPQEKKIAAAIKKQVAHGPYPQSDAYYKKDTSTIIARTLSKIPLYTQKRFYD